MLSFSDANQKLHDTNDDLRAALESIKHRRLPASPVSQSLFRNNFLCCDIDDVVVESRGGISILHYTSCSHVAAVMNYN